MSTTPIVDAHAHIFLEMRGQNAAGPTRGLSYGRAAIGVDEFQFLPPFNKQVCHTAEMLIHHMDWAGIDRAVLLQGPFYGECNDYVRESATRFPERLIAVAYADPWANGARASFDRAIAPHKIFRGVKIEFSQSYGLNGLHPDARLDDAHCDWLWRELEQRGMTLTFDLGGAGTRSYQTEGVRRIAERHPGLTIVIAHLGWPNRRAEADPELWSQWHAQLALGQLPNVYFDFAALPASVSEEGYPFPSVERYLRIAVERIGAHKLIWGTDVPGTFRIATYQQFVALARQHTAFLSPDDQAALLGGTALKVYG